MLRPDKIQKYLYGMYLYPSLQVSAQQLCISVYNEQQHHEPAIVYFRVMHIYLSACLDKIIK